MSKTWNGFQCVKAQLKLTHQKRTLVAIDLEKKVRLTKWTTKKERRKKRFKYFCILKLWSVCPKQMTTAQLAEMSMKMNDRKKHCSNKEKLPVCLEIKVKFVIKVHYWFTVIRPFGRLNTTKVDSSILNLIMLLWWFHFDLS